MRITNNHFKDYKSFPQSLFQEKSMEVTSNGCLPTLCLLV